MIVHTAPLDRQGHRPTHVLIYLQGMWQLQLCRHIFSELSGIEWVVLIEGSGPDAVRISEGFEASNVTFAHTFADVLLRIDVFSAVFSTFAIPHRAHLRGIQLYAVCSQLGIPFFELQHGMFQIGVNYQERARIVGDGFYGAGSALPIRNFHDHLLAWSGEEGIGYPGYFNLPPAKDKGYCLILSNMHWNIYGEIDQTLFFESVLATVAANPGTDFIWKPHPSEISRRTEIYFKPAAEGAYANLRLMTNAEMEAEGLTTEVLIRECSYAISSLSTVLLELEMYRKKVAVYAPAVARGLWSQLKTCSTFIYPADLLKLFPKVAKKSAAEGRFDSGLLKAFSPERLEQLIAAHGLKSPPAKGEVARAILPLLNRPVQ